MTGAFSRYCNSEHTLAGSGADGTRPARRCGPRARDGVSINLSANEQANPSAITRWNAPPNLDTQEPDQPGSVPCNSRLRLCTVARRSSPRFLRRAERVCGHPSEQRNINARILSRGRGTLPRGLGHAAAVAIGPVRRSLVVLAAQPAAAQLPRGLQGRQLSLLSISLSMPPPLRTACSKKPPASGGLRQAQKGWLPENSSSRGRLLGFKFRHRVPPNFRTF
jgi:hypothetical protein